MRAVVRRGSQLEIDKNYALPEPGPGQMIVKTLCCGICGSDLHALHHMDHFAAIGQRSGALRNLQASHDLVFGHEFCAEIVDYGPGCSKTLNLGRTSFRCHMLPGLTAWKLLVTPTRLPEISVEDPSGSTRRGKSNSSTYSYKASSENERKRLNEK